MGAWGMGAWNPPGCAWGAGGAGARFEGVCIIRVYSLGPCCTGGGAGAGRGAENAPVALDPYPDGVACAGGGGPGATCPSGASDGLPNIRVNSPTCWGGGAAGAGGVAAGGNPEGDGNCGPACEPGGGALKNLVNSPPCEASWDGGAAAPPGV
jgi:hypothetical protein